ncbi:HK97-gp10 family putative phage morphogenesis protein [Micromonospora chersina]|uniref:HK97-gp10 family putative phage morphogenesis protein n=1 Tax=Micromonospora chersina TaxID=47854 RepID=UPI003712DB74
MSSVWFDGIEELNTVEAELRTAAARVGVKGSAVVRASALKVEAWAKQFAPVDTGHLKGSIGPPTFHGDGRSGVMEAVIEAAANYSGFVEWGTSRMAPRAFMGPALDRVAPDYIAAMEKISDPLEQGGR